MEDTGAACNCGTKRIVIQYICLEEFEVVGCFLKLIQMGIFGIPCAIRGKPSKQIKSSAESRADKEMKLKVWKGQKEEE